MHPHPANSKQFQRLLNKQGLEFKLNTKVLSAEKKDGKVLLIAESAKNGKQETVRLEFSRLTRLLYLSFSSRPMSFLLLLVVVPTRMVSILRLLVLRRTLAAAS